ncbi:hypothetical protein [Paludisphaera mucosa]|uniref:Uncharacterized protein n=1 Tax=Paludisphaera mucosa TaxID=3030827 RepID=A0ABT6FEA2_9BACT|nr:hypothetical protein [Paludisphaera mucosa]MDG3005902.1 hypothetical protein [Paludisphaera mucosa]
MNTDPDVREALYNDRPTGPVHQIQLPTERITVLHGFMLDLDPKLLRPGNALFPPDPDPRRFYENIRPVLLRHPIVRHAEIRASGTGLHALVHLEPPVELTSAADQRRWAALVRSVQCTLPSDPAAPGITALTRPVGSTNSKNGAVVETLWAGEPIAPGRLEEFVGSVIADPFRAVATILLGADQVRPCPVCRGEGSRLDVLARHGFCYEGCRKIDLGKLLDAIYKTDEPVAPDRDGPGTDARKKAVKARD